MPDPTVREVLLYEIHPNNSVRCRTCNHGCMIRLGRRGICRTRENINGKLFTVVYGDISSLSHNPIEKKPLFHYHPNSIATTIGTWSCTFKCNWCQNWSISKSLPPSNPDKKNFISPKRLVSIAMKANVQGISVSFNEPTLLLEYCLDLFPLAKREGLYCMLVTNGYMTPEALNLLIKAGMSGMSVNIKGDRKTVRRYSKGDVERVWENLVIAIQMEIHVEVVTLIIPTVNDNLETFQTISKRIKEDLGEETPLHFTAFHPAYKATAPPTPVKTLERAHKIAKKEGLEHVYLGNVPGHPLENSYCPKCKNLIIERSIVGVKRYLLNKDNTCPHCGKKVLIIGNFATR